MTEILSLRRLTKILPLIYEIGRLFEKKAKKKRLMLNVDMKVALKEKVLPDLVRASNHLF